VQNRKYYILDMPEKIPFFALVPQTFPHTGNLRKCYLVSKKNYRLCTRSAAYTSSAREIYKKITI